MKRLHDCTIIPLVLFAASIVGMAAPGVTAADAKGSSERADAADKVSGIDQSLFSETVAPGENFYLYANMKWLDETEIPSDKSNYGIFTVLDDRTREQVRELIEAAAEKSAKKGTAEQKVGDLYRSVINTEARDRAGLEPIRPLLEWVAAVDSPESLAATMAALVRSGMYGPFAPYVSVDARDSESYTVYLTQTGLTMPDRDYYIEDEDRYVELRDKLKVYVADMLEKTRHEDPEAAAEAIFKIETAIAQSHWTKTENRDPVKTYNKQTPAELAATVDGFAWDAFADAAGLGRRDAFVVRQPSYFEALGKMFSQTPLEDWKAYLEFRVIDAYADSLSQSTERRHFDFHRTAISGIGEQEPMWKRAVGVTGSVLGELVGKLYVDDYFQAEAKRRMNELVDNLKLAFDKRIRTREWMTEGTKKQALEKLSMITTKIGYPDEWKDYSKLSIEPKVLAENMLAASEFEYNRDLAKLDGPVDRKEWHMTPQTINAYYNPTMNEIVFPAAILQPPFFNLEADDAVNYGAIGAVIGHELSHAFDDKGSKYDGTGNLRDWWTPSDRREFERRAEGLVAQYNEFQPFDDMNVKGELTLGENIGDLGGLSIAYEAYQISLAGEPAPVIDGLTGDQRFFLGWSQIWRRLYREPELRRRLIVDPHSPSEYRVNGIVRNMDAWYDAFDVGPDAPLYLPPDERVRIW